jgi:hypothetical protein
MTCRPPVFAGGFYAADPVGLAASVDAWLQSGLKTAAAQGREAAPPEDSRVRAGLSAKPWPGCVLLSA